ncbi:MAG: type II toxin-antitoxin system RelE/ParE family toxin [Sulfuricurvum sp.]
MTFEVIIEPEAIEDLIAIRNYISKKDSKSKAVKFVLELKASILSLSKMPMRCRRSFYSDNDTIRDLIFKRYTIVYKIEDNRVYVLTIFRQREY